MDQPNPKLLEYPPPELRNGFRKPKYLIRSILLIILILSLLLTYLSAMASRSKCIHTLRSLGLVMKMYANEFSNSFPPDLKTLAANSDITPELLNCPANDASNGRYVYWGNTNLNNSIISPKHVLLTESTDNHLFDNHVLMGDGSVKSISRSIYEKIIKELQAGQNPPPSLK